MNRMFPLSSIFMLQIDGSLYEHRATRFAKEPVFGRVDLEALHVVCEFEMCEIVIVWHCDGSPGLADGLGHYIRWIRWNDRRCGTVYIVCRPLIDIDIQTRVEVLEYGFVRTELSHAGATINIKEE